LGGFLRGGHYGKKTKPKACGHRTDPGHVEAPKEGGLFCWVSSLERDRAGKSSPSGGNPHNQFVNGPPHFQRGGGKRSKQASQKNEDIQVRKKNSRSTSDQGVEQLGVKGNGLKGTFLGERRFDPSGKEFRVCSKKANPTEENRGLGKLPQEKRRSNEPPKKRRASEIEGFRKDQKDVGNKSLR